MLVLRPGPVGGRAEAPASKSYTHRAFVLAALSGDGIVESPLRSGDTDATRDGLRSLGFAAAARNGEVRMSGRLRARRAAIDAANSGTTLRILTPVASLQSEPVRLSGDASLRKRPMAPLLRALAPLGVRSRSRDGRCPLVVRGPMSGGATRLDAADSSQFLTGLLLATVVAPEESRIALVRAPRSQPYIDITQSILSDYGLKVTRRGRTFSVPGHQRPRRRRFRVPGDWSSAAFLLSAAAVGGGRVEVTNLDTKDVQGDRAILSILRGFGCRIRVGARSASVEGSNLRARRVNLARTPDLFPYLCAVGAVARGRTVLYGAPHLRLKESDRIAAMRANLLAFGIFSQERKDGLVIEGGHPRGATIRSFGDHRIAQAGLLLGLAATGPSRLADPHVLGVSYPGVLGALKALGGRFSS